MLSFFKYFAVQTVLCFNDPTTFVECVRLYDDLAAAQTDTAKLLAIFEERELEGMDMYRDMSEHELAAYVVELAEGAANAANKKVIKGFTVSYRNWRGTPGVVYVSTDDSEAAGSGLDCFGMPDDQIYYYFQLENPCQASPEEFVKLKEELVANLGEGVPSWHVNKTAVTTISAEYDDIGV
jgi:hypothetical protein